MGIFKTVAIIRQDVMPQIFTDHVKNKLESFSEAVYHSFDGPVPESTLIGYVQDADFVITSWGSPQITARVIQACPKLKLIGHAAGSIKNIVSPEVFDQGIVVVSAAESIARYVAEMALGYAIALIRQLPQNSTQLKASHRKWRDNPYYQTDSLYEQTIGLVGLGLVAGKFIQLLQPFHSRLFAYDPFISNEAAQQMGVTKLELDELLKTCKVISLHAALLPATRHLIDARRLQLIQDGAILINTARGALIDETALAMELKTGRFKAALDSYENEPLPADSVLRDLGEHVMLTPHSAGPAFYRRWDLGLSVVQDIQKLIGGEEIPHKIRKEQLASMA